MQKPKRFRNLRALMVRGLGQLHVRGELPGGQQLADPRGGVLPRNDLRVFAVPRRCTVGAYFPSGAFRP